MIAVIILVTVIFNRTIKCYFLNFDIISEGHASLVDLYLGIIFKISELQIDVDIVLKYQYCWTVQGLLENVLILQIK